MRRSAAHDRECLSLPYGWAPRSCGGGLCARGAKRRRKAGTWGGEGGARGARARAREKEGDPPHSPRCGLMEASRVPGCQGYSGRWRCTGSWLCTGLCTCCALLFTGTLGTSGLDPDSVALCLSSLLTTIAASSPPITAAIALHGTQAQAGRRLLRPTGRDPGLLLHHRRPAGQARERERERERSYRPHATLVPPTSCRSGQRERERARTALVSPSYHPRTTLVPACTALACRSCPHPPLAPHAHAPPHCPSDALQDLFEANGFETESCVYVVKRTTNRKTGVDVPRIFVQGKFVRKNNE